MGQRWVQFRSFGRPAKLLMINQFGINLGFYMLMPYLANHLSAKLLLASWLVGLILGVRNFSQQGMFAVGGSLADRWGYKPMILAGCGLRTVGFVLLGLVDSVPALIAGAAATGVAGALFNPAVRAYLAADAGPRRVEAFAAFNVFYQAGILLGPVVGLALTTVDFRLTCLSAAAVFAVLTVVQWRALPPRRTVGAGDGGVVADVTRSWRQVLSNRSFMLFTAAMAGSYVLSFQVYLALPLAIRRGSADPAEESAAVAVMFAASGLLSVLAQMKVTAWCRQRWTPPQSLVRGLALLAAAFAVPATAGSWPPGLVASAVTAGLLIAVATMIAYPFEMDTIVALSGGHRVATHYGVYQTVCGAAIAIGNLVAGAAFDAGRGGAAAAVSWLGFVVVGVACAVAVRQLSRRGLLEARTVEEPALAAGSR
ncbi:MFS transporter [Virgisporangium aliadipatigenens]|nr:MFS transporter [Virgisporangium aliadipatigenens]